MRGDAMCQQETFSHWHDAHAYPAGRWTVVPRTLPVTLPSTAFLLGPDRSDIAVELGDERCNSLPVGKMTASAVQGVAESNPDLVREAKRLRRRSPKGHQRSLRDVAAELAKLGFLNERGRQFSASSIASMLEG
jgi:hypothetical protein